MIELWQVALGLTIFSFGAWFEIERTFGPRARGMKKKLVEKVRNLMLEIQNKEQSNISEESIKKIVSLYKESELPTSFLEDTTRLAMICGMLFLISVASRLGVVYMNLPELLSLESMTFIVGFVILLLMIYNLYSLRKLISSESDPPSIPIFAAIAGGLAIGIDAYFIWLLMPIIIDGRAGLDTILFVGLLFLSILGALIFLWGIRLESKWRWTGYGLMVTPWLYLIGIALITRLFL